MNMDSYGNILLTIPVVDVLTYFGKRADHRSYMYYSPFRDESSPSMRVTVKPDGTWIWADFGSSPKEGHRVDGGGILDMVKRLSGVHSDKEAWDVLGEIGRTRGIEVIREESRENVRKVKDSGIVVDDVSCDFTRKSLVNYAVNVRRIPQDILSRYCRQVTYHSKSDPSHSYTVIGFPNNAGGFAMRGSTRNRKLNNIWGISTLGPDGVLRKDASAVSPKCATFEGFMDFLSYLSWRGVAEPGMDVCILHSASNAVHAKEFLLSHESVRTFFDNDEAGTKATELVRDWCDEKGLDFKDGRSAYPDYNDINEAWQAVKERRNSKGTDKSHIALEQSNGLKI